LAAKYVNHCKSLHLWQNDAKQKSSCHFRVRLITDFFGYGARSSCHVWTNRYTENAADETMQFVQSYGITISITIWL